MSPDQFERLPESFRAIVEIDREFRKPVVPITLAQTRRYHRRMAEIACLPPRGTKAAHL